MASTRGYCAIVEVLEAHAAKLAEDEATEVAVAVAQASETGSINP